MKKVAILLVLGVFLTVSCEKKEQEPHVSNVNFTPCKQEVLKSSKLSGNVEVEFTNKGVQIKYYDFEVACDFTTVNVTHTFVNGVLNITQQGSPNQANCVCHTDVSYTISGIAQSEVNVIFINGVQVYCHNVSDSEKLCLYLNSENIDKTVPIINEFLEGLPSSNSFLGDEQNLQALREWLKSNSCVIDATILCISCIYTYPAQSEISFSFKEGAVTKEVILDIIMTNPLKAKICSIKEKDNQSNCDQDVIISAVEYENAPNHPISIIDMKIEGNCLKIKFGASGCSGNNWIVKLIDSGMIAESLPCQRQLRLSLNDIGDCDAYFENEMSFNIEDLQIQGNKSVILHISGKTILYEY